MKKIIIIVSVTVGLFLLYIVKSYRDWNLYCGAPIRNSSAIFEGYEKYVKISGGKPSSLEELVALGCLPEEAKYYNSYLKHGSYNVSPIHFKQCEFGVKFDDDGPIITIPKQHFSKLWISRERKNIDIICKLKL